MKNMKTEIFINEKNRIVLIHLISLLCISIISMVFLSFSYQPSQESKKYLNSDPIEITLDMDIQSIAIKYDINGQISFVPGSPKYGLIFYPGGKVDYESYAPILNMLAHKGILCVVVRMPFNLAIFNPNRAEGIQEMYPEIDDWYIAGHSLGGVMAAKYVSAHADEYDGIIFLAAYTTNDLHDSKLRCLSIYGTNDGVLNMKQYKDNIKNFPNDLTEIIIDGGCHAYFGSYGEQKGDREATITAEEQWKITSEIISNWIGCS